MTSELVDGQCLGYSLFVEDWYGIAVGIGHISIFYLTTLAIFIFCYWRILAAVRRQASAMAAHSGPGSSIAQAQLNHIQSSVVKTMIMVSTFYAIAWLPLNVYYILMMFVPGLRFQGALYYVTMFVAFVYTSANPFIYATNFDAVRKVLVGMIGC